MTTADLERLAALASAHDLVLISREHYSEMCLLLDEFHVINWSSLLRPAVEAQGRADALRGPFALTRRHCDVCCHPDDPHGLTLRKYEDGTVGCADAEACMARLQGPAAA